MERLDVDLCGVMMGKVAWSVENLLREEEILQIGELYIWPHTTQMYIENFDIVISQRENFKYIHFVKHLEIILRRLNITDWICGVYYTFSETLRGVPQFRIKMIK